MKRAVALLFVLLLAAPPVLAQEPRTAETTVAAEECEPQDVDFNAVFPEEGAAGENDTSLTGAEQRVQEIVAQDGVHVVRFWAPWCDNSIAELKEGWYALAEQNPDVSFTFVTIWNDGEPATETMEKYAIPDRVVELTQPDYGPSNDKSQRRREFLGLPVTWIPSTWIFHENGELAFALNYGEMSVATVQHLIDATRKDWSHD